MASAYAALVSLLNVLNRVQRPTCPASFNKKQMQSLFDKVSSLVDFLDSYSQSTSKDLEGKIIDAAYAAQDKIESYVVARIHARLASKRMDRLYARFSSMGYVFLHQYLKKAIKRMDLIIQEAVVELEGKQKRREKNLLPRRAVQVASSIPPTGTIEILGFREELNRLLEQLATDQPSRQIIPLVGMGGIGKSTLANSIYDHPYVRDTFDVKAWVTISQVYDIKTIIHHLLHVFGVGEISNNEPLEVQLHKHLFGRKYLVILDDIWDSQAWEGISRFLPDNGNGSRVLLTTRILDVAQIVGSVRPYEMQLLDDEKSWDLLSKMVFGQDVCPPELETCGRRISKGCKGLPLAIVVIVGVLKMSDNTLNNWEDVSENISSIISQEDDDHCLKILSLSYHDLPIHLKPCFLYMASFPEDYEIRVSEVTMLWAADGFLKPNAEDTLEEVALRNLNDLINRNLIMVKKRDSRGRMKCLIVHDLVRDVCMREAQMERFLDVDVGVTATESQRRIVLHRSGSVVFGTREQKRLARSFISFGEWTGPLYMPVLSLLQVYFESYHGSTQTDIGQLANLRFIKSSDHEFLFDSSVWDFDRTASMFSSISFLWNLDTLIVKVPGGIELGSLPCEIWDLRHIKHLIFSKMVVFPDPPANRHHDSLLNNLQTLKNVEILSKNVLFRFLNVRDLGIQPPWDWTLCQCLRVETLYLDGSNIFHSEMLLFPDFLKKLTLSDCRTRWERMRTVGYLRYLEVLKLKWFTFIGEEWNSIAGQFQRLKVLSIERCNLSAWIVEDCSYFPCLEQLRLRNMENLEEIPQAFGESMTLKSIRLERCKVSVIISAKQILDEQESMGYDDLTVEALYPYMDNEEQELELESLSSDRFHVQLRQW